APFARPRDLGRKHAIELGDGQRWVADHRVVRRVTLRLLDVVGPLGVPVDGIDGNADDFYVAPIELGFDLGHVAELGGAHGREVLGMREQHRPGIPNPVVELDAAGGCIRFEVRSKIVDLQCHDLPLWLARADGRSQAWMFDRRVPRHYPKTAEKTNDRDAKMVATGLQRIRHAVRSTTLRDWPLLEWHRVFH